jgi:hypothetical protein
MIVHTAETRENNFISRENRERGERVVQETTIFSQPPQNLSILLLFGRSPGKDFIFRVQRSSGDAGAHRAGPRRGHQLSTGAERLACPVGDGWGFLPVPDRPAAGDRP